MLAAALALALPFALLSRAAPTPALIATGAPINGQSHRAVVARSRHSHTADTSILNFALTLEYIENAFYKQGLADLDEQAFADAGFAPWVRGRFVQIGNHEATHVAFLRAALGGDAVQPCNYS